MRCKYIFQNDHYYHTLKSQVGHGIPVFHGVHQRGGGIGDILGGIAKYALPLIAKYILPHATSTIASTLSDVSHNGFTVKQALKKNSLNLVRNVAGSVADSVQKGKCISKRRNKSKRVVQKVKRKKPSKIKRKKTSKVRKGLKKPKKNRKKQNRSKLDIFF